MQLPGTCPLTPLLSPQVSRQVSIWVTVSGTCLREEIHKSEQLRTGEGGPVEALLQGQHSDHRLRATGSPMLLQRKGAHALTGWYPASGENFFTRIPRKNRARWGQGREVTAKGLWSLPSMELGARETPHSDCSLGARLPGSKGQVLHLTEETPGKLLNFSLLSFPSLGSGDDSTPP